MILLKFVLAFDIRIVRYLDFKLYSSSNVKSGVFPLFEWELKWFALADTISVRQP